MEHTNFISLSDHYFDQGWGKLKHPTQEVSLRSRFTYTKRSVQYIGNILTKKECDYYIAETEKIGYKDVDWEYHKSYRSCKRVVVKSEPLANEIWKRIMPNIINNLEAMNDVRPYGFGNEGTWKPIGINECIRFIKYEVNDHFQPHRDGIFVRTEDERSIYTLMIYLNDKYTGGETVHVDDHRGNFNQSIRPPMAPNQMYTKRGCIAPGTLVYFLHDICHHAEPVGSGVKYILRTDIMFKRIDAEKYVRQRPYLENPLFIQANALYYESIDLQKKGDPKGSTEKYLEAQELQTRLSSLSLNDSHNASLGEFQELPLDILRLLLSFLSPAQILKMGILNKAFSRLTRDPLLWRSLYAKQWPDKRAIRLQETVFEHSAKEVSRTLSIDWCSCFRNRLEADKMFECVIVDVGFANTSYHVIKKNNNGTNPAEIPRQAKGYRESPPSNIPFTNSFPSLIAGVKGHYWSADSAFQNSCVGDDIGQYGRLYNQRGPYDISFGLSEDVVIQILLYVYYRRHHNILPSQNPLVLCVPPYWTETNTEILGTRLLHELAFSYICFLPTSALILLNFDRISGIVVTHEHFAIFVTPVFEGEPRRQLIRQLGKVATPEEVFNEIVQIVALLVEEEAAELLANIAVSGDGFSSVTTKIDFCQGLKDQFSSYNGVRKPTFFYSEDNLDTIHGAQIVCDLSPRGLFRDQTNSKEEYASDSDEETNDASSAQNIKTIYEEKKKKERCVIG